MITYVPYKNCHNPQLSHKLYEILVFLEVMIFCIILHLQTDTSEADFNLKASSNSYSDIQLLLFVNK